MHLAPAKHTQLRRAFVDICQGYSLGAHNDKPLYVKHLSHFDQQGIEEQEGGFAAEAVSRGAVPEADRLTYLISKGVWSQAREDEIARQKDTIQRFEEGKKTLIVPSMIRRHEAQIQSEKDKLTKMMVDRAECMGITAEVYAHQRLNDYYILHNLFLDKEMRIPALTEDSFEDMSDSDVQNLIGEYNRAVEPCSDANLKLLSVQDYFLSYFTLCADNLADFYGKPVVNLTFYQCRLANMARYYKSIMDTMDMTKVPLAERNDPGALERFHTSQKNQAMATAEGRTPNVGLSRQDIAEMGLEGQMAKLPSRNLSGADFIKHIQATAQPV